MRAKFGQVGVHADEGKSVGETQGFEYEAKEENPVSHAKVAADKISDAGVATNDGASVKVGGGRVAAVGDRGGFVRAGKAAAAKLLR